MICSCMHLLIVLQTYVRRSGDHRVTGVHGSMRQDELLPTIYPEV